MPLELPFRFEEEPLLWTVEEVYSPEECQGFVELIDDSAPSMATNNPMYRNQDRVIRDDAEIAEELFRRLRGHLPERIGSYGLVGLNDRLRFYRYSAGQYFQAHMDHWYRPSARQITLHTVLVYFNGDFEGGETRFCEQLERTLVPKAGLAAIFQHKIRHEGLEVRRGYKYVMRTDVIYEAPEEIPEPSFPD